MKRLAQFLGLFFALLVLFVSLFESVSVKYAGSNAHAVITKNRAEGIDIVYGLPYAGAITPTSPLWPIKAARDRMKLSSLTTPVDKSNYMLLLSDKRLALASHLWSLDDLDASIVTFSKAEMYLRNSADIIINMNAHANYSNELLTLNQASLKHRQILEQILAESSDDTRPRVIEIMNNTKYVYTTTSACLSSIGVSPQPNVFEN